MIEVQTPDGGIAQFPDGTTPDAIKAALQKKFPPTQAVAPKPSASWADTAVDAAKSFGTGIEQGAIGLAGMPADIGRYFGNAVGGGVDWLMGATPEQRAEHEAKANAITQQAPLSAPTSETLTKTVEGVQGPMYQPQTTIGKYANTVGQFVPGAVAGPGGLARKAALAVVPGVASEAAGQATEGTAFEPYARMAGALAGGIGAAERSGSGTRQMLKEAPTWQQVADEAKASYDAIDKAGIVFDSNSYKSAAMKIKSDLAKKGWDTLQGGQVAPLVNRINGMLKPRAVSDWTKVDGILKDAKAILRNPPDETTKMHVSIIVDRLENLVKNGKIAAKKGSMTRPEINDMIAKARDYGRRNILARDIQKMKNKSEWYVSGDESGIRNKFASYGKATGENLSDAEKAAYKAVVRREGWLNPLHNAGSRLGQIAVGSIGANMGGLTGALVSIIGTNAVRKFMEVYTMRGVDAALKTVLAGRSAQEQAAIRDIFAKQGRAQTLLAAESGGISAQQPTFLTDANGQAYPYPAKTLSGQ